MKTVFFIWDMPHFSCHLPSCALLLTASVSPASSLSYSRECAEVRPLHGAMFGSACTPVRVAHAAGSDAEPVTRQEDDGRPAASRFNAGGLVNGVTIASTARPPTLATASISARRSSAPEPPHQADSSNDSWVTSAVSRSHFRLDSLGELRHLGRERAGEPYNRPARGAESVLLPLLGDRHENTPQRAFGRRSPALGSRSSGALRDAVSRTQAPSKARRCPSSCRGHQPGEALLCSSEMRSAMRRSPDASPFLVKFRKNVSRKPSRHGYVTRRPMATPPRTATARGGRIGLDSHQLDPALFGELRFIQGAPDGKPAAERSEHRQLGGVGSEARAGVVAGRG